MNSSTLQVKKQISCLVQSQIILFVAADNSIKGCHLYVRCGAGRFCENAISFYLLFRCYCCVSMTCIFNVCFVV